MQKTILLMLTLNLAGCVSAPQQLDTPVLVEGIVSGPTWTGWILDHCDSGRPKEFEKFNCVQIGGEINSATLTNARIVNGPKIGKLKIAFVAHALSKSYRQRHYLVLQPSPADFRTATGIEFFSGDRDNYDVEKQCLSDQGWSHIGFYSCRDEAFHRHPRADCVPLKEYLEHYRTTPNNSFESDALKTTRATS
jgi:hypothetical protein